MDRSTASAVEIRTWINRRLADHPACAGFILGGMLDRVQPETDAQANWRLATLYGDSGTPSRDCLDCLAVVLKEAQLRFTLE